MENTVSAMDSFAFAWKAFTERPLMLIGGLLLVIAIVYGVMFLLTLAMVPLVILLAGGVAGAASVSNATGITALFAAFGLVGLVAALVGIVIGTLAAMSIISFFLKAHDDLANLALKDLVRTHPFWKMLGATLLVAIVTQIGLLLFVLPGIIAAFFLMFVSYLILDKGVGIFAAFGESIAIVKDHFLELLLLMLGVIAANIAGALLLGLGLLVSVPVSLLAVAHAYRVASRHPIVVSSPAPAATSA